MSWAVSFTISSLLWCTRLKGNRTKLSWPKSSKTMSHSKSYFTFSWFSWAFCHSNGKLTNTTVFMSSLKIQVLKFFMPLDHLWIFLTLMSSVLYPSRSYFLTVRNIKTQTKSLQKIQEIISPEHLANKHMKTHSISLWLWKFKWKLQ